MAGVLFMACIPTKEHEKELNPHLDGKSNGKANVNVRIASESEGETVELRRSENAQEKGKQEPLLPKKGSWDRLKDAASPQKTEEKRRKSKMEVMPDTSMEEVILTALFDSSHQDINPRVQSVCFSAPKLCLSKEQHKAQ